MPLGVEERLPFDERSAWIWLVLAVGGYVVGQIAGALLALVLAVVTGHAHSAHSITSYLTRSPVPIVVTVVGELGLWLGFGGAPWLASRVRGTRRFLRDLGLRFKWVDLPVGVAAGVAGQFGIAFLYLPFTAHNTHLQKELNAPAHKLQAGVHGWETILLVLVLVVGAPLFEELFFRGLILPAAQRLLGRFGPAIGTVGGIILTGVIFGLAHFEPLQFAGLALFGMLLSYLAWSRRRLGPNMIAHASFNAVAVAVFLTSATAVH